MANLLAMVCQKLGKCLKWVCWRVTPPSPKGETILSPHALYRPFWTVAPSSSTEAGPEVKGLGFDFTSSATTLTQKDTSCNYEFWETVWLLPRIRCMSSQDLLHFAGNVLFIVQTPGPIWGCPGCRWPLFLKKLQRMPFCSLATSENHLKGCLILVQLPELHKTTFHSHVTTIASKNHENVVCFWN